ncbi:MAG: RNase adapter RapZ [Actinobacteria bacterium]|nr:RNase adapter RapZ [Actinomycetota bacterium]
MSVSVPRDTRVVVVTGMSGAGRSTASYALEDLNWFVIDNLPPALIRDAVAHVSSTSDSHRIAVVADIRGGVFFDALSQALDALRADGVHVQVVFLDAPDDVLVRRFEYARRPHPLQGDGTILDGVAAERERIADLRSAADAVIDTGTLSPHQLRERIIESFGQHRDAAVLVTVQSFGFKFGLPMDADVVFDARFIPNPHWDPALRPMSGLDAPVRDAVLGNPRAASALEHLIAMLASALPGYIAEGKRYVSVAVGCTGGRHRSVAIAEELSRALALPGVDVHTKHRDIGRS